MGSHKVGHDWSDLAAAAAAASIAKTFSSFSRARDNILSLILWTVLQILKPPPGRRSKLHDDQTAAMTLTALIPRTGLKEIETNQPWNWRFTVPYNQDDADQTTDDQFQNDCQSWLCFSTCRPLPPPIKAFAPWWSGWRSWLWTSIWPSFQLPAFKINFPFHQTGLFKITKLIFWVASRQIPLWVTVPQLTCTEYFKYALS